MKRTGTFVVTLLALTVFLLGLTISKEEPPQRVIDSFSDYKVGRFPRRLRTYPFQRDEAKKVYRVAQEGNNRFLRADDPDEISVLVLRQFYWDIEQYPWISWKWRARTLPVGADERDIKHSNDSACGVYIVFGKYTGKALKYVWSTQAPVGTVVRKKPDKFHMIVKNSGPANDPQAWHTVSVNVAEAYRSHFGEELDRNPTGFGLLTDGNAVHAPSACDYDEFTIATANPEQPSG